MTIQTYDIIAVPDPVLKETAHPVSGVDTSVQDQMDRMLATMYEGRGIGLAANQVGMLNRVLVMDVEPGCWEYGAEKDGILPVVSSYRSGERESEPEPDPLMMANPEIVWKSEHRSVFLEGCLSIPGQYADVVRPAEVKVKYLDRYGKERTIDAAGLVSHCLQHEIDHLNGTLFIDHISSLKRNMILRRVKKLQKDQIAL